MLEDLPTEIISKIIFKHSNDIPYMASLRMVCRLWRDIIDHILNNYVKTCNWTIFIPRILTGWKTPKNAIIVLGSLNPDQSHEEHYDRYDGEGGAMGNVILKGLMGSSLLVRKRMGYPVISIARNSVLDIFSIPVLCYHIMLYPGMDEPQRNRKRSRYHDNNDIESWDGYNLTTYVTPNNPENIMVNC